MSKKEPRGKALTDSLSMPTTAYGIGDWLLYQLPWKSSAREFGAACYEMLETWLKANGFGFAWRHFFLHCDCDGGWTAKQCKRLVKDLDRITPGERGRDAFIAFREIVREAAKRNEGLKIS